MNDGLLRNTNATSCWYVNGHGGGVSIGANLHFSNGQYVSIAAMGDFTVHRPSSSDFVRIANEFVWDAPELTGDMQWKVKLNSKYDGLFGTTQLLSADGGLYDTGGSVFLDGDSEIYGEPDSKGIAKSYILLSTDPLAHITSLFDTPRPGPIQYTGFYSMIATFRDYLRFKPDGADNIWITIATNGWSMDGRVAAFSVSYTNIPPASAPVDNDEFPDWDGVRHE